VRWRDAGTAGGLYFKLCNDDEKRADHCDSGQAALDKDTGMTSYVDESGNKRQINSSDVSQLVEDN
jgi:hypothetical protein